ncbi:hypothetical protein FPZ12_012955 [Amycolatopsis acidicola]|uniref:Uncharacterized protein n=1 Tax=Amycolatopsis acidicola TaxID=2596893 RepID=A0A5N0V7W3_9PSEU|nr:hypothetical protein FPZ12_012955 [Amycolatopsis acidicola]
MSAFSTPPRCEGSVVVVVGAGFAAAGGSSRAVVVVVAGACGAGAEAEPPAEPVDPVELVEPVDPVEPVEVEESEELERGEVREEREPLLSLVVEPRCGAVAVGSAAEVVGVDVETSCGGTPAWLALGPMDGPPAPPAAGAAVSCSCPALSAVAAIPASAATPAASTPIRPALRRSHFPSRRSRSPTGIRSVGVSSAAGCTAGNSWVIPSRASNSATVNRSPVSPGREFTSSLGTVTALPFVTVRDMLNHRYQFVAMIVAGVTLFWADFRP